MTDFKFDYCQRLGDQPLVFATVLSVFVAQIAAGVFAADRRVPNGEESVWVVSELGEHVAFATFYQPDGTDLIWLDLLWVSASKRRKAIGSELIALVEAKAREAGCNRVEWGTLTRNDPMHRLSECVRAQKFSIGYRKDLQPVVLSKVAE